MMPWWVRPVFVLGVNFALWGSVGLVRLAGSVAARRRRGRSLAGPGSASTRLASTVNGGTVMAVTARGDQRGPLRAGPSPTAPSVTVPSPGTSAPETSSPEGAAPVAAPGPEPRPAVATKAVPELALPRASSQPNSPAHVAEASHASG